MVNYLEMDSIIERAKEAFGARNQEHLAEIFGILPSDFSKRKKSGTLTKLIEKEAYRRHISYDWIRTGHGSKSVGHGTGPFIGEQDPSYQVNMAQTAPDITPIHPSSLPVTRTQDLLSKTAAIIESRTLFADALKSNIEAFHVGLSLQQDLAASRAMLIQHTSIIEKQNQTIEEQNTRMNTIEERLRSMEQKKAG